MLVFDGFKTGCFCKTASCARRCLHPWVIPCKNRRQVVEGGTVTKLPIVRAKFKFACGMIDFHQQIVLVSKETSNCLVLGPWGCLRRAVFWKPLGQVEAILKEAEVDDKGREAHEVDVDSTAPKILFQGLFDYKALAKRLCEGPKRIPDMP